MQGRVGSRDFFYSDLGYSVESFGSAGSTGHASSPGQMKIQEHGEAGI
jgi:hypothetical protein